MAISINAQPNGTINYIGNSLIASFTMSGVSSGSITSRFGYQLCDGDGNALTARELISPKDGVPFSIDFREDVNTLVFTAPPQCLTQKRDEPEMLSEIVIKYWQLDFDKDTCESTTTGQGQLGPFPILNSAAEQFYGYGQTGADSFLALTQKPACMEMCADQCDLFYLYSFGASVVIVSYDKMGGVIDTYTAGAADACSFVISPELAGAPTNEIYSMALFVGGDECTRYLINQSCCCSAAVYFQSVGGGYSVMHFDEKSAMSVKSSYSEICRYQERTAFTRPHSAEIRLRGGVSITNKKSNRVVTLTKTIDKDAADNLRYYEDFLASGSYYIEIDAVVGSKNAPTKWLVKFMPTAGSLRYYEKDQFYELTVTGKIANNHELPNYRI